MFQHNFIFKSMSLNTTLYLESSSGSFGHRYIFGFNFVNTRANNILVSFEMYVQLVVLKLCYSFVLMKINIVCE